MANNRLQYVSDSGPSIAARCWDLMLMWIL